jgi:hypothetical protein
MLRKVIVIGGNGFIGLSFLLPVSPSILYLRMNNGSIQARLSLGRPSVTAFRLLASGERNCVSNRVGQTKLYHSSSGRPFQTPKGHSPAWTEKVVVLRITLPLFALD